MFVPDICGSIRRDMFFAGAAYLPEFYRDTPGGVLGEASAATAETGEKILALTVRKLRDMLIELQRLK